MSSLFERWSPEYALNKAFDDMRESGLDGLKKHLTSNALMNVESIESISERPGIALFTKAFMGGNGSESSKAIIGFEYQDLMAGTIELKMIKEGSIWKIDSLAMPKFDKFNLPQENTDQPAE